MTIARARTDGYDVATDVGVLHFDHEPEDSEVVALVAALSAPPEEPVNVEAEEGVEPWQR